MLSNKQHKLLWAFKTDINIYRLEKGTDRGIHCIPYCNRVDILLYVHTCLYTLKVRNVYALLSCTVDPMVSPFVSLVFDLVTYFHVSWNSIGCFYSRRCILALATLCSFEHSEFGRLIVDIVFHILYIATYSKWTGHSWHNRKFLYLFLLLIF